MAEVDLTYGADLAARLARVAKAEVRLVYLLEVTRTLPLNAPLPEQEEAAQEALSKAVQAAKQQNVQPQEHVERVREAIDGTLAAVRPIRHADRRRASKHAMDHGGGHDRFDALVDTLLHRASCEVIVGRSNRE